MADAPTCNALASPAKDAGNSSFAAGRYQEAYDYYSQAIQADPDSALLRSNRSGALAALGRHVEALADADKCCQLRPDWYKSHVRRGHAMFQLNRVTDAEACYQEALHLNPEDKTVEEALERCLQRKRGGGGNTSGAPAGAGGGMPPAGGVMANPGMQSMPGMQMPGMPGMQMQPMPGMGMQQPMMGMQQPMMGMQQPMMGMQQSMMGMQQPGALFGQQPAMQPPAAHQDLRATASGAAGFPSAQAGATGALPTEFHKLTEKEMRQRLEESVAKLSDEQLDEELRSSGINLPPTATRAEKVQHYLQVDMPASPPVVEKKKQPVMARFGDATGDTRGDRLMEKRKRWVEEWSTWDEERLLHRLLKLGIDASGNPKARLIDILLEAETERFNRQRCTPKRLQFVGLACAGATILGSFVVVGALFAIGI